MLGSVVDLMGAGIGIALLALVAVTVWLVVRDRPALPSKSRRAASRRMPRSMAGWQRSTVRQIRRSGGRR